jgi:3-(3-hydroxy-phenyl)propionate hydroxylase
MNSNQYEVVIVGCGPTGAALANMLGCLGVSVCVVERNVGVLEIPRAVHIDGETMRVFQSMGMAPPLLSVLRPGGSMHWVNAQGELLLVREGIEGLGQHGWHGDYYYHQPQLEAVLREGMKRFECVTLREGVELQDLSQDEQGVTLQLHALADGSQQTLRTRYVVGCDGARSKVRQWVGGESFEDLGEHQAWLVVDAVLHRPLDLPEHSVQYCDPARPGTGVYVHPLRRRWELMVLPGEDVKALVEPAHVWKLLSRWIKPSQGRLERAATYMFHSLVAHEWQKGRLLLAGDAVHQTPPFLGQGLCAAIRDVANLSWKLAFALQNPERGESVLATYGVERKPHAREFVALAVEVGKVIQVLDPVAAAERDRKLTTQGLTFKFPSPTLGAGVHRAGKAPNVVGKVSPQFEMPDGRWSDDAAGSRFSLLCTPGFASLISAEHKHLMARMGIVLLAQAGEKANAWLAGLGAAAALLRPDRYVFDVCASAAELPGCLRALAECLGE